MQKLIHSLNLRNIELKGFTSKLELLKSMRQSKFVAIPSTYEACPMVLLESMCLGKIPLMLKLPFSCELTENGKKPVSDIRDLLDEILGDLEMNSKKIQD